ncbi:mTERF domain-containing protein [Cephalotus follicularis]|uniref:mTERF domain-containing protein n=1 Tax=Cephalotus follicularis TaxID=3775 RepID=A0A1Q3CGH1_CEPFO|nr:mTERF domain-containing protein [Cephalotus follicularis]
MLRFSFIYKSLLQFYDRTINSKSIRIRYIQTLTSLDSSPKSVDEQSSTVSYLVNSCGLSLNKAISASKYVKIGSTKRADSVLELLTTLGFTKSHISIFISGYPRILNIDPDKILKPKIEYLKSMGILGPDLCRIVLVNGRILLSSLQNHIIPTFDFLKGFFETNENLICALKPFRSVLTCNLPKVMMPNIATLRAHGLPELHINRLMVLQPQALMLRVDLFEEAVDKVKEMGFEPSSKLFIVALRSVSAMSKVKWAQKKEVLMSFGWSEEIFNSAFRAQPMFMATSEKKFRECMNHFVNKLGLKPSNVAKCPNLFLCSLERRIIPRYSYLQVLMSKGFIKREENLIWTFNMSYNNFEKKFVTPYKEKAPEVIKAYQREMGFQGVGN